jgi:intracellular sulfur oxidation DsrE/DsrF family protein
MFDRFLHTLEAQPVKPQAICFYTEGVKLVCKGSSALQSLSFLQGMGVRIVSCTTCLDYFKIVDQVAIGEVGNMNDIVKLLLEADKAITV